ncbi:MAG: hypothetical protein R3A78_16405 [Polyangiales bacterium]|nr:hypothetical protein [Myxococcales bacterium]
MAKAPLALVKDRFKDKEGLVKAVRDLAKGDLWLDREVASGLDRAPNRKLLKLHDTLSVVKKEFGSRSKLVEAIVSAEGRAKDKDAGNRYESWPVPRLYDRLRTVKKSAAN